MDKSRFEMITDEINQVILRLVEPHGYGLKEYKHSTGLFLRIDLLERMLELLRIRNKYLENNLPIELFIKTARKPRSVNGDEWWFTIGFRKLPVLREAVKPRLVGGDRSRGATFFTQGNVQVGDGGLHFIAPKKIERYGSGTPPIQLQPKLLLYLFYRNFGGEMQVYDIIDTFIKLIWDQLTLLDFKKTQTGVTRRFTNTRFAANTLRAYGLLKFTKREAYKTWMLSLSGLLVASALAAKGNWELLRWP